MKKTNMVPIKLYNVKYLIMNLSLVLSLFSQWQLWKMQFIIIKSIPLGSFWCQGAGIFRDVEIVFIEAVMHFLLQKITLLTPECSSCYLSTQRVIHTEINVFWW